MKKFIAVLLCLMMAASIMACGSKEPSSAPADNTVVDETKTTEPETTEPETTESETTEPETTEPETTEPDAEGAEENGEDSVSLEEGWVTANVNGLLIGLPNDFDIASEDEDGTVRLTNEAADVFIMVSSFKESKETSDAVTKDAVSQMFAAGYEEGVCENLGTIEQPDGAKIVIGFGSGLLEGEKVGLTLAYYFPSAGGGYYLLNYVDKTGDSATEDMLSIVTASLMPAE